MSKVSENSGYSLPTAMLVALLVSSMLFGVMGFVAFSSNEAVRANANVSSRAKILSGITYSLAGNDSNNVNVNAIIDSLSLYKKIIAKDTALNKEHIANYTFGAKPGKYFSNALTISQPNLRAAVTGNTQINGDLAVTRKRITEGKIYGVPSLNSNYHSGQVKVDEDIPVKLFDQELITGIFRERAGLENHKVEIEEIVLSDTLAFPELAFIEGDLFIAGSSNSSRKERSVFYVSGNVEFDKGTHTNHSITIICGSEIIIGAECNLSNLVLAAKGTIEVSEGCSLKGTELISLKGISAVDSEFLFPSALALYSDIEDTSNHKNSISIENTVVNGTIILANNITGLRANKSKIFIDNSSTVHGVIYSENLSEIRGRVLGSVYTYSLLYSTDENEYVNWLVNLNINRNGLDNNFLMPPVFGGQNKLRIVSSYWQTETLFEKINRRGNNG